MGRLGRLLRQKREGQNLDLAQVQAATGIPEELAAALERDDYKLFFSDEDMLSHLRVYSRFLGLEVKQVLALYQSERSTTSQHIGGDQEKEASIVPEPMQEEATSQLFRSLIWLLSASLILGLLAVALLLLLSPR